MSLSNAKNLMEKFSGFNFINKGKGDESKNVNKWRNREWEYVWTLFLVHCSFYFIISTSARCTMKGKIIDNVSLWSTSSVKYFERKGTCCFSYSCKVHHCNIFYLIIYEVWQTVESSKCISIYFQKTRREHVFS